MASAIAKPHTWLPPLLILAGFLYFVQRTPPSTTTESPADDPHNVLIEMVRAVKKGDVDRVVSCFSGPLQQQLEKLSGDRESNFRQWLQERQELVKGFAIIGEETLEPGKVQLQTETVYDDRKTSQTFVLERRNGEWKIVETNSELMTPWEGRRRLDGTPVE